jgi:hypothetical protein
MKLFILAALFISPVAFGYGYTVNSQQIGNTIYTNTYGNGYNSNYTTQTIGNSVYTSGYDNQGNHVNCTTYGTGNFKTTTCN